MDKATKDGAMVAGLMLLWAEGTIDATMVSGRIVRHRHGTVFTLTASEPGDHEHQRSWPLSELAGFDLDAARIAVEQFADEVEANE